MSDAIKIDCRQTFQNANYETDDVVLCLHCGETLHDEEHDIFWSQTIDHNCAKMNISTSIKIKPLDLNDTYFVIHSCGSITFFDNEEDARSCAYQLSRNSYKYDQSAIDMLGKRGSDLKNKYDIWAAETQSTHEAYIRSYIDFF